MHDVIASEWVSHGTQSATATPAGLLPGIAGVKQLHDEARAIWPDNRWTIEDIFGGRGPGTGSRCADDESGDSPRDISRHSGHGEAGHVQRDLDLPSG